jgi:hypothetical protein
VVGVSGFLKLVNSFSNDVGGPPPKTDIKPINLGNRLVIIMLTLSFMMK